MRNSLKKVEGVRKIEVDIDEKTATVIVASKEVDTSLLVAATTNIGFPSVVREPELPAIKAGLYNILEQD